MDPMVAVGLAVLSGFLLHGSVEGQAVQGPLVKPEGLCATFVLPQGLSYSCDEYVGQTSDGFLLGVQRIYTGGPGSLAAKKPVFVLHGVLAGGDSWLLNPTSNSLPLMLANDNYDVWIGNVRTTNYSSGHITLTRDDQDFWTWSIDDLAAYDLPTMLGVVSSKTTTTMHYIGYSQGTQMAIAAFSQGQLLTLVDKVVMIAPVAYVSSVKSIVSIAAASFLMDQMMLVSHLYEFNLDVPSEMLPLMERLCATPHANCSQGFSVAVTGPNCCINTTRLAYYDKYETQPTSTMNMAHFAQQFRTRSFAKYDYGWIQNWMKYKSFLPPDYDISAIPSMPLLLIHGSSDGLADVDDVNRLVEELKFAPQVELIKDYGHLDFMVGNTAGVVVYSKVMAFLAT